MKELAVLALVLPGTGCKSITTPTSTPVTVEVWPGWKVVNSADLDMLTAGGKDELMEAGSHTLERRGIAYPFPPPGGVFSVPQDPVKGVTHEALTEELGVLLSRYSPTVTVESIETELHEKINGHWVCKVPTTLSADGAQLAESVTIEGIDFELVYDLTLVLRMD